MSAELRLYVDGTSRGDPPKGAVSWRLLDSSGEVLIEHAEHIGKVTSHEAKYRAVILGLSACQQYAHSRIHCFSDSELMVREVNGEHPVDDPRLKYLVERVHRMAEHFKGVVFGHVRPSDAEMVRAARIALEALGAGPV